jgi:hypothetical protein
MVQRKQIYEIVGNKVVLTPHRGQQRAWDSLVRFIFLFAGTQGGKTSFLPWWLWREMMNCGAGDYLAVTASYDLFKLKFLPEMRNVFEHVLSIGRYWAGSGVLEIRDPAGDFWASRADDPMWARIILRSASAPGGLESTSANAAVLDEFGQDSFTIGAWEAIRRRLSLTQGRVLGGTTPYNLGWTKQLAESHAEDTDIINFASTENPAFPKAEFEARQKTMPAWKFNMFYRGLFERPAGMIYGDFKDYYQEQGGHKVRPFILPTEWARYVGVDPGAVHHAMVWLAHDPSRNVYYLYRESLEGGKSTPEYARTARNIADYNNERVVLWYVGQKAEVQQRLDWQAAGVPNVREPSIHEVESGIDRVIQLWRQHRLFIFDNCTGILDEIGRYVRVLDAAGEPTEKIKDKETFHRLDALRYAAVGVTTPVGVLLG